MREVRGIAEGAFLAWSGNRSSLWTYVGCWTANGVNGGLGPANLPCRTPIFAKRARLIFHLVRAQNAWSTRVWEVLIIGSLQQLVDALAEQRAVFLPIAGLCERFLGARRPANGGGAAVGIGEE